MMDLGAWATEKFRISEPEQPDREFLGDDEP